MNLEMWLVLGILLGAILLFVTEWVRLDVVAFSVVLLLMLTNVLGTEEALSGFANSAVITIASLFVVGGGIMQTGLANRIGRQILYIAGDSELRLLVVLMLAVAFLSSFMSDTGTVAVLLPAVAMLARSAKVCPSKLLIPLSFGALLGGATTLIGTTPNIIVAELLKENGLTPFQFFDFMPSGIALVLAGVIFMMVIGVNDATRFTYGDKLTSIHNYQISLQFENPARVQRTKNLALTNPNINAVESWLVMSGKARASNQPDSEVSDPRIRLFGMPADSNIYSPDLQSGRWIKPGDGRAAVISKQLADETGWNVGQQITITAADGREDDWLIVGIAYDPIADTALFVPLSAIQKELGLQGQANTLFAQSEYRGGEQLGSVALQLSDMYTARGYDLVPSSVFGYSTINEIVEQTTGGFSLILQLLAIMAVIIAVVGGVGLSGVLSLNVLERRREIGVMRSVGASTWRVIRLYVSEGVILGWLSWMIALPLSIPAAYFLATRGLSFALNQQLVYTFSPSGALIWLVVITFLAVFASSLPARGAAKLSVNESLAY